MLLDLPHFSCVNKCVLFFHYQSVWASKTAMFRVAAKCARGCVSCRVKICQLCTNQEVTKVRIETVGDDRSLKISLRRSEEVSALQSVWFTLTIL